MQDPLPLVPVAQRKGQCLATWLQVTRCQIERDLTDVREARVIMAEPKVACSDGKDDAVLVL